jgi:hypothetical protein
MCALGRDLSLFHSLQTGSAAYPASCTICTGGGALSLGLKRSEHAANHLLQSSARITNAWIYTYIQSHSFMGLYGKVIPVLNYVIKQYLMKSYAGVDV